MSNVKFNIYQIENICENTIGLILYVLASSSGLTMDVSKIPEVSKIISDLTNVALYNAIEYSNINESCSIVDIILISVTSVFAYKGNRNMKVIIPVVKELIQIWNNDQILIYPEPLVKTLKSLDLYDFEKYVQDVFSTMEPIE